MKVIINGRPYYAEEGETILQVAKSNNIFIPTLCHFQPIDHKPGTCRVCLSEVTFPDGHTEIVTSCNTPVEDGMEVNTVNAKVRELQRLQVEMIFADHDQDCIACARHGECELQDLGEAVGLKTNRYCDDLKPIRPKDGSMRGLVRDMSKCVRCLRCVSVCRKVQGVNALSYDGIGCNSHIGVGMAENQNTSACIQCGQCILVCPTGALAERDDTERVMNWLATPSVKTYFAFAPSVRVTLGEEFGMDPGSNVEGRIAAALRRMGADFVLDTDFAADVVIMEEGTELLGRIKNGGKLPMFTSCCPGWMNFAEKHIPDVLPHISTTRSPQAVQGSLAKTYFAERANVRPEDMRVISIMPCTAKKDEAGRARLQKDGRPDTDVVLTVREFATMLRRFGIDLKDIEPEPFDDPNMSASTGAAVIFGVTGGVMEAALRTVYYVLNGKEIDGIEVQAVRGEENLREATIDLGPQYGKVKAAICHGLGQARKLAEQALRGESPYVFIEVMACPGGCVAGGGTKRLKKAYHPCAKDRAAGLYNIDREMPVRQSHNNAQVQKLYKDYLGEPNSHLAHELLHTWYKDRSTTESASISDAVRNVTLSDR